MPTNSNSEEDSASGQRGRVPGSERLRLAVVCVVQRNAQARRQLELLRLALGSPTPTPAPTPPCSPTAAERRREKEAQAAEDRAKRAALAEARCRLEAAQRELAQARLALLTGRGNCHTVQEGETGNPGNEMPRQKNEDNCCPAAGDVAREAKLDRLRREMRWREERIARLRTETCRA